MENIDPSTLPFILTSNFEVKDFLYLFDNNTVQNGLESWVIDALKLFENMVPIPPTYKAFQFGEYFRLDGHKRSFCYNPFPSDATSAICIKGCEVFSDDIDDNINNLTKPGTTPLGLSGFEHFVTIERKVPTCLTYSEAIEEALIAAELQSKYIVTYNELAPLPLPIKVLKLADDTSIKFKSKFLNIASKEYYNDIANLINKQGLAIYIYYYPVSPMRLKDMNNSMEFEGPKDRQKSLKKILVDPENVVYDWVTLFARLLCIGYVPGSTRSTFTGFTCDMNNVSIGGGYTDVGSIESINNIYSDRMILEAIQISLDILCESILQFLIGTNINGRAKTFPLSYIKYWTYSRLCEEIRINKQSIDVHPIVIDFFNNYRDLEQMSNQFMLHF